MLLPALLHVSVVMWLSYPDKNLCSLRGSFKHIVVAKALRERDSARVGAENGTPDYMTKRLRATVNMGARRTRREYYSKRNATRRITLQRKGRRGPDECLTGLGISIAATHDACVLINSFIAYPSPAALLYSLRSFPCSFPDVEYSTDLRVHIASSGSRTRKVRCW